MQAIHQDRINEIAEQPNTVVYEPTYDTTFDPWPAARVKACVYKVAGVARSSCSQEVAAATCLNDSEILEFSQKYQVMFKRLSEPAVSRNDENVGMFLNMIDMKEKVRLGVLSESDAKRQVSDAALATLLRQSPNAPPPPADLVEEL
jgi:hypothetical protein|tara:strand:+ start:1456 stop:1896 length:441 start_codon:yes stop_codon:yes gene_type:complete